MNRELQKTDEFAILYQDAECHYISGHPTIDLFLLEPYWGRLELTSRGIVFRKERHEIALPKDHLRSISYCPTPTEGHTWLLLALFSNGPKKPALRIAMTDPEGVITGGFDIRFAFRDEYRAKVFGKRAAECLGLSFSAE